MTDIRDEGIAFKYVNDGTLDQCLAKLRAFFGENYFGANRRYVEWQYRAPFAHLMVGDNEYSILGAMDGDTIIALDAFVPWKTFVRGKEVLTVWDLEWLNCGKVRGMGRKLVSELRSRTKLYCGYGVNSYSTKAFKTLGFSIAPEIERMVAILDPARLQEMIEGVDAATDSDRLRELGAKPADADYVVLDAGSKISEAYFEDAVERFHAISYKGPEYIKWRYFEHPLLKYQVLALDAEGKNGIATVRVERVKGAEGLVLRILDFLPVRGFESELTDAVLSFGREHGAVLADFFCSSFTFAEQICPSPFVPLSIHSALNIPRLFQPLEVRERKSINMVMDANEEHKTVDFESIYTTKADGDQDVWVNDNYTTIKL
jgi:hypothetical protein